MTSKMTRSDSAKHTITRMLQEWNDGKREIINDLMPLVYDELHRQAKRYLSRERVDHTLQTTALIHEAYLKLIDQRNVEWESRTHFYAIAAQAMRRILVDYARTQKREKRGGNNINLPLDEALQVAGKEVKTIDLIALDEALTRLAERDERQARVVELRYFADLTLDDTAIALGVSRATAALDWSMAKSWLFRELKR
jgi:RNA polymerase sigma factor (TIGR02999 family)